MHPYSIDSEDTIEINIFKGEQTYKLLVNITMAKITRRRAKIYKLQNFNEKSDLNLSDVKYGKYGNETES